MRLIDAGKLIAEMHNIILEDGEDRSIIYEVIERQPTIKERRRGRWIKSDDMHGHRCSSCHRPIVFVKYDENDAIKLYSPFCPWCGAEMDEGEE